MNPAMKQRLVGTLVLGSLALILVPLLLDGEGVERPPLSATIPPAPVFDTTPLPEPERPVILADSQLPASDAPEPELAGSDLAATPSSDAAPEDLAEASPEPAAAGPAPAAELTVAAAEAAPAPQSASAPALDASGLPEGWTVRLGSFGNRANADALVARLTAAGHKAYIRPVVTGQGTLHGVFVGPVPTRNEAGTLQAELKSRFQISDAIVQRYDIAQ